METRKSPSGALISLTSGVIAPGVASPAGGVLLGIVAANAVYTLDCSAVAGAIAFTPAGEVQEGDQITLLLVGALAHDVTFGGVTIGTGAAGSRQLIQLQRVAGAWILASASAAGAIGGGGGGAAVLPPVAVDGTADSNLESSALGTATYSLAASTVDAPRTYTPADGAGAADGQLIQLVILGVSAFGISAGGATFYANGGKDVYRAVTFLRVAGVWTIIEAGSPGKPAPNPLPERRFLALVGTPDTGTATSLGFLEFDLEVDNGSFDWSVYTKMQIPGSTNYQRRVTLQAQGGGPTLETVLDEITGGDGMTYGNPTPYVETTVPGRYSTSLVAGTYRMLVEALNQAGDAAPTTGWLFVQPLDPAP